MEITAEEKNNILILSVSGMLDASNYLVLEEVIQSHISDGSRFIVFNLHNLEYMSSAGVRVFIKVYRTICAKGGAITFSSLQPFVLEIFEIAGLTSNFSIFPDDEQAVLALSSQ